MLVVTDEENQMRRKWEGIVEKGPLNESIDAEIEERIISAIWESRSDTQNTPADQFVALQSSEMIQVASY